MRVGYEWRGEYNHCVAGVMSNPILQTQSNKLANRFDSSLTKEPRLFTYRLSFLIMWLFSNYKVIHLIMAHKQTKKDLSLVLIFGSHCSVKR